VSRSVAATKDISGQDKNGHCERVSFRDATVAIQIVLTGPGSASSQRASLAQQRLALNLALSFPSALWPVYFAVHESPDFQFSPTIGDNSRFAGIRVKQFKVSLADGERHFLVQEGEAILTAALRQGVMLPYSCKNGTCGSCKGKVLQGEVHYPFHPPLALERTDYAAGNALMCQAEPLEDLIIQVREIEAVRDIEIRMLPARVAEKSQLSPSVVRLRLKLPKNQRLQFLAGQYVDVLLKGGKRRAFSIASCPSLEDEIELHIRHVEGGDFTGYVFDTLQELDIIRFEGPLGNFFVRNDQPERPMIMVGGGTGFAPLKSMIENLLEQGDRREIHLYWGARQREELYLDELPQQWAKQYPHIHYQQAISEQDHTAEGYFAGLAHQAVLADHPDLSAFDVYMSGPPAMIDAARSAFLKQGLNADRLYYDSFEFGLDVPVRVLARLH